MSIITLLTDFGTKDHFVGSIKGKLLSKNSNITIVDITHEVDPFNIFEASYLLSSCYSSFPKKTIHIVGVDIEKNQETQHVVMEWNDHFFISADNGILSILTNNIPAQQLIAIDHKNNNISDIDSIISVANDIVNGVSLEEMGYPINTLKQATQLQAIISEDSKYIKGYVVYIDHLGNAVTNISKKMVEEVSKGRKCYLEFKNKEIKNIYNTYSEIGNSDLYKKEDYIGLKMAVYNNAGFVEIAVYKSNPKTVGSAHSLLGLNYRDPITIYFEK